MNSSIDDLICSKLFGGFYFFLTYRIRANKMPFLIKPPLQQNLNKPPLFCPKSPLFEAFWGKNPKIFNRPPPWNPQIFINRRRLICADTVLPNKVIKKQVVFTPKRYKCPKYCWPNPAGLHLGSNSTFFWITNYNQKFFVYILG